MITSEEQPRSKKLVPKMFQADLTIPKPNPNELSEPNEKKTNQIKKPSSHSKNLSIQTDLISNGKNPRSFDLKQYLNRNSPKYYNLKEKLLSFQNSAKAKTIPVISKSNKRNYAPITHLKGASSFHEQSGCKNAQNSTIDQTPIPKEKDDSRRSSMKKEEIDADYENNFIVAKINNFFKDKDKETKQEQKTPTKITTKDQNSELKKRKTSEEFRTKTPIKSTNSSMDSYKVKKIAKNKINSEERPKTAFSRRTVSPQMKPKKERSLKKYSYEDQDKKSKDFDELFQINENIETEDLHNRYEKELQNLLGKELPLSQKKKTQKSYNKIINNSMSGPSSHKESIEKTEGRSKNGILSIEKKEKKSFEKKENPKEKRKKSMHAVEMKEYKGENPQIPLRSDDDNIEEVKTRQKKKTLEKFITQINRGEIFAIPNEESEEKPVKKPVKKINNKLSSSPNDKKFKHQEIKKNAKKSMGSDKNIKQIPEKKKFIYYTTNLSLAYKSLDSNDYFVQLYKEHFSQTFQALSYCKGIKQIEFDQIEEKKVFLKKRDTHLHKKTLIFDLDETLIHCNELMDVPSDVVLPITFPNGEIIEAGINVRPYLYEALNVLKELYEIIVFTASHNCYANKVLDYLDPKHELIHHRLFREHCVVTEEGIHIKDLRVLANRKIEDIVIVDNACYSFGYQIDNGIPIIPYYDNKQDEELKYLLEYLKGMVNKDIKEMNRKTFKLTMFQTFQTIEELAEVLFDETN